MREIKFRGHVRETGKVYDVKYIDFSKSPKTNSIIALVGDSCVCRRLSEVDLIQYTGLKDKNGKEIYEGDILQWKDETLEVLWGNIGWDLASGLFKFPHQSWKDKPSCGEINVRGYIVKSEVIGNIYENADLLKETTNGIL